MSQHLPQHLAGVLSWRLYSPRFPCKGPLLSMIGALLPSDRVLCQAVGPFFLCDETAVNWAWRVAWRCLYKECVPFISSASLLRLKLALHLPRWCYLPTHNWFCISNLQEAETLADLLTLWAFSQPYYHPILLRGWSPSPGSLIAAWIAINLGMLVRND